MEPKLFAFWRYDTFPYVLGAEITKMKDGGQVQPVGYGGGYVVPIKILPLAAGKSLWDRLKQLQSNYDGEQSRLKTSFVKQLKIMADFV
jgi:hypothetical protein